MTKAEQLLSYAQEIQIRIEGGRYTLYNEGGRWSVYEGWSSRNGVFIGGAEDLMTVYGWLYEYAPVRFDGKLVPSGRIKKTLPSLKRYEEQRREANDAHE